METLDNHNQYQDQIDAYLRGKMSSEALQDFEILLKNNEQLRQNVAKQQLLVSAIKQAGEQDIREFLRKNTGTRKTLILNYKAWVYASAAVIFLAVVSGAFIIFSNKKNKVGEIAAQKPDSTQNTVIAQQDKISTLPESSAKSAGAMRESKNAVATDKNPINTEENQLAINSDNDGIEDIKDLADLQVLGKLSLKPIVLEDVLYYSKNKQAETADKKIELQKSLPNKNMQTMDSNLAAAKYSATFGDNAVMNAPESVKFNFTQSPGNSKEAIVANNNQSEKSDKLKKEEKTAPSEITLVNVPYDNQAQIYFYKDKYFFKTGEDLYEIKLENKNYQKLNQVTDHKIIQAIKSRQ